MDFHWEVNGKVYEFSIPGGGFVTLQHLVEVLDIANNDITSENASDDAGNRGAFSEEDDEYDVGGVPGVENGVDGGDDGTDSADVGEEQGVDKSGTQAQAILKLADVVISDKTREFVSDVEKAEFSNPELVWVGKVEADTTVGMLKDINGLECWNSEELTKEQLEEINAQTVEAGDWALISMLPFMSEETLTISMKNGDQFVVIVTDAQDPSVFLNKKVIIYDNGEQRAILSSGYTYDNRYRLNSISLADAEANEAAHWKVEQHNDNYYLKSSDNRYFTINSNDVGLVQNKINK